MEENREKNNKKIEDEKRLEQDLRQMADDVILPDSLEPEAIQKMLQARQEEKQQGSKTKKNKKNWKRIVPIAAAACVCVIVGATVGIKQINKGNNKTLDAATIASAADQTETTQTLTTAKDYKEIEKCIKEYNKQMARDNNSMAIGLYESASSADAATAESSNVSDTGGYSDTNVRENGVGEADIVKTDGKNIYTLCRSVVTITAIDNGSIHNLAKDETIYSARFMGDTGYFVTYRQVDPLFSVDLSDPKNPKILGELKIPGFSEYLHPYGDGKLLGIGMDVSEDGFTTEGVKLSMFNVTDPSNVTEENKYTIEESYGTDVGYNYKGVFVDVQKNLFGFVTYHDGVTYQLYTYDEAEGFKEVMSRQLSGYEGSRGLYIGDVFYLVSGNMIESYSMNGFEKMDDIVL